MIPTPIRRRFQYGLMAFLLVLVSAGLVWIIQAAAITAGGVQDQASKRALAHMAWLAMALLGVTLVVLLWVGLRWLRLGLTPKPQKHPQGPRVSPWSEAGRRIVPDEDEEQRWLEETDYWGEDESDGEKGD